MNVFFIIIAVSLFIYILHLTIGNKLDVYESFFWVCGSLVGIFLSVFPKSIDKISQFLGVNYPPTLFLLLCILFLLIINFRTTRYLSKEKEKVMFLAQEIAILKKSENDNVKRK